MKLLKHILLWIPVLGGIFYLFKIFDDFFLPIDYNKLTWNIWKIYQSVIISAGIYLGIWN